MKTDIEAIIRESVGTEALADYMTAPCGQKLAVYADGKVSVGESVGMEIAAAERPIAIAKCPGIGNIDMTWWREGWDCDHLSDEEVIHDCCENGDVDDELNALVEKLRRSCTGAACAEDCGCRSAT